MNRVKKSTFSLLFILKKSKLLKNGEAPICLRITVQGQTAEVMVKRSISVHLWNQAKECSNGKQYKDKELNHYLETIKAKFYQIHRELEIDRKFVKANAVRDRYNGKDESSKTLTDVYREHNRKCRQNSGAFQYEDDTALCQSFGQFHYEGYGERGAGFLKHLSF